MGRVGGVGSGAGFDLVYGYGDAFDGGSGDVLGLLQSARYDNMVTYQTAPSRRFSPTNSRTTSPSVRAPAVKTATSSTSAATTTAASPRPS